MTSIFPPPRSAGLSERRIARVRTSRKEHREPAPPQPVRRRMPTPFGSAPSSTRARSPTRESHASRPTTRAPGSIRPEADPEHDSFLVLGRRRDSRLRPRVARYPADELKFFARTHPDAQGRGRRTTPRRPLRSPGRRAVAPRATHDHHLGSRWRRAAAPRGPRLPGRPSLSPDGDRGRRRPRRRANLAGGRRVHAVRGPARSRAPALRRVAGRVRDRMG